jgi:hypothetical protein
MKRLHFIILTAILFLLSSAPMAFSQPQSAPTGLALEVTYFKGRPPAYQTVLAADLKSRGDWYALFGHVASWQPPAGFLPVQAVNILPHVEGDEIRVEVSVFVGASMPEKELPVTTYRLHVNETIKTSALTQFGVEPFEIKVKRMTPTSTALPQVVSKADSVAVLNIEANNSTLPSYNLQLRNLSNKNILALGINLTVNNRLRRSAMPRDPEGRPLIEAGAVYNHSVSSPLNAQSTSDGYTPDAPMRQEIVVTMAFFDDGSYEGDANAAAKIRAFLIGEKTQVGKVVPLFQDALNEKDPNVSQAIEKFRMSVDSLSKEVDPDVLRKLQEAFPGLNQEAKAGLKIPLEVSLNRVKFDLLKSLQELERANGQSLNAGVFQEWLAKTKERYEKWLSRLKDAGWLSADIVTPAQ